MTERYTREAHDAYVEAEEAKKAKEEQDHKERSERETARRAWVNDGGSAADFERNWSRLRDEGRAERVKDADRRAREGMRETSRI